VECGLLVPAGGEAVLPGADGGGVGSAGGGVAGVTTAGNWRMGGEKVCSSSGVRVHVIPHYERGVSEPLKTLRQGSGKDMLIIQ